MSFEYDNKIEMNIELNIEYFALVYSVDIIIFNCSKIEELQQRGIKLQCVNILNFSIQFAKKNKLCAQVC